jgi:hypothetical protein
MTGNKCQYRLDSRVMSSVSTTPREGEAMSEIEYVSVNEEVYGDFDQYMRDVDGWLWEDHRIPSNLDIPDFDYYNAFADDVSARLCSDMAIEAACAF